jgi:hypothetical protein
MLKLRLVIFFFNHFNSMLVMSEFFQIAFFPSIQISGNTILPILMGINHKFI